MRVVTIGPKVIVSFCTSALPLAVLQPVTTWTLPLLNDISAPSGAWVVVPLVSNDSINQLVSSRRVWGDNEILSAKVTVVPLPSRVRVLSVNAIVGLEESSS